MILRNSPGTGFVCILCVCIFLRKCSKLKDAVLPALTSYSKGKGQIPWEVGVEMEGGGGGDAENSAAAQWAISVFLSQKNKKSVRTTYSNENHIFKCEPWMAFTVKLRNEALTALGCSSSLRVPPLLCLPLLTSAGSNWLTPVCSILALFLGFCLS